MYITRADIYSYNKLTSFNNEKYSYNNKQKFKSKPSTRPTFTSCITRHKLIRILKLNPIYHFDKFTTDEYNHLTDSELMKLRRAYHKIKQKNTPFIQECEDYHHYIADFTKKRLDKMYGEDNYKVIVVGRSLSSIGKLLGYKIGEDNVINLPLSLLYQYCNPKTLNNLKKNNSLKSYNKYLSGKGLSQASITQNPNTHYIFIDYIYSGDSMRGLKKLLNKIWEKPLENVHFMDITDGLPKLRGHKSITYYMDNMMFKKFAFVEQAEDLLLAQSSERISFFIPKDIKLFWFKLLDDEMKASKSLTNKIINKCNNL